MFHFLFVSTFLFVGWLRETTLSYDSAFYTAGGTVLVAAALLSVVKMLHKIQRHDCITKVVTNYGAVEEADSAASEESDKLLQELVVN